MKTYTVNEIFYSLQGEGFRAGSANVFVRFAGCNLTCSKSGEAGFDCDTEFTSGIPRTTTDIIEKCNSLVPHAADKAVIFTGGEPLLQLDSELVKEFQADGWYVCVETNGTFEIPPEIDWVSCSPKTAEHTIKPDEVGELRYVRHAGQGIPKPRSKASVYYISPAAQADGSFNREDMAWCIQLVKNNPNWRLSIQQHKMWGVR